MFSQEEFDVIWPRLTHWFRRHAVGADFEALAGDTIERCVRAVQRGQVITLGYVFAAANSVLVDYHRKRHPVYVDAIEDHEPSYELRDVHETPGWFQELPVRDQTILALRTAGYSNALVGECLGTTKNVVRRRVTVIRQLLEAS